MKLPHLLLSIFAVAVLAACWLAPNEQELEQAAYCRNVRDGVWPDFNKSYKDECGGKDPPKFNETLTK